MVELDKALSDWLDNITEKVQLTTAEKAEITGAGAKVLADDLKEVTREKHYRERKKGRSTTHLADSVLYRKTDIDGAKTGVSTVGFDVKKQHIARFLNDGTKFIKGDHFVENTRRESQNKVVAAEKEAYTRIMKRKGGK
ncbi:HK97-gp10 family putative phage morphogenesis protein [Lentilactobacillus senioris]|uniref:HK97-gp10 family putative phage morphogenesis protein n=1 Tax=Lentilactobacillus senioris TaxID=931534 RepID=UPI003D2C85B4